MTKNDQAKTESVRTRRGAGRASATTAPVQPGDFTGAKPEFGRTADCNREYGLKRGTLYNLFADGKIKGCLLRVRGQKSGVRLWDMESIRHYIRSQMDNQTEDAP